MNDKVSKKTLKQFSYLIGFGFPIIIGFIIPKLRGHDFMTWTFYVGMTSLLLGILKPNLLHRPYKYWMSIGHVLGWINGKIILSFVFFIVLIPISLFMRIFGHDPLRLKSHKQHTYREDKTKHKVNLKKIF